MVTWGEDVKLIHRELLVRFGPERVRDTPISESAFLYAGIGAAMAGLRPVVEIMLIDFLPVAWSGIVNAASKFRDFSGGALGGPAGCPRRLRRVVYGRRPARAGAVGPARGLPQHQRGLPVDTG